MQSKNPCRIDRIKLHSKQQETKASRVGRRFRPIGRRSCSGEQLRGGGHGFMAAVLYRGGGSKRRAPSGAAAHRGCRGPDGEAGEGRTAANRAGGRRPEAGEAGLPALIPVVSGQFPSRGEREENGGAGGGLGCSGGGRSWAHGAAAVRLGLELQGRDREKRGPRRGRSESRRTWRLFY